MGSENNNIDVVILGGGPAGLSASMWCVELGIRSIVLEKNSELGGQLHWVHRPIRNYPAIETANGLDFLSRFVKQLGNLNFEARTNVEITKLDLQRKMVITSGDETLCAKALIIATGVRRRKLGVEGEIEFVGRGILDTGQKDRYLLSGKRLMIVGGGDAAFENAAALGEYAGRVFLVHRRSTFTARKEFVDRVKDNTRVEFITDAVVKRLLGRDRLESVEYLDLRTGTLASVTVDALLIRIGVLPNTELLRGSVDLDASGYIRIGSTCETSVRGVYAIGDVANPISPTVSTAIGNGATAAKSIAFQLGRDPM